MRKATLLLTTLALGGGLAGATQTANADTVTSTARITLTQDRPKLPSTPDDQAGRDQPAVQPNYPPAELPQTSASDTARLYRWVGVATLALCVAGILYRREPRHD